MLTNNNDDYENRPRKYGLTEAHKQRLLEQHEEQARLRQAANDLNLLRAAQLSKALKGE